MNYKQIVMKAIVEKQENNTSYFSYFERQAKIAEQEMYKPTDFFDGCNYVIGLYKEKIISAYEKRYTEIDFALIDYKKANIYQADESILKNNPKLIVIKSISKSYGVPGFRLGLLATDNKDLVTFMKKDVSIWNINSFAEFYLQIFEKYKDDFDYGITKFKAVREKYAKDLSSIGNLRVIPSHANYILCEIIGGISATDVTKELLDKHSIFIKDLSNKNGFSDEYIRVAVKRPEENELLVNALKELL